MNDNILFTDMDGTLLNSQKQISFSVKKAIISFVEKGGRFVLSSGRPINSILDVREKLGLMFPNMYIIAYNGALVYDCDAGMPIHESKLPLTYVRNILDLAHGMSLHCQTYSSTHIISEKETRELAYYQEHIRMPSIIVENASSYLKSLNQTPYKMLAISLDDRNLLCDFQEQLSHRKEFEVHTFFSGANYLECCAKEASKGNAVRFLCDYLGLPIENAYAAGDAANDISMLVAAGTGVAMKNAVDEVISVADLVTERTNDEDGILEILHDISQGD